MIFDHAKFAQAFRSPGQDPRKWVSYATVDKDTPESPAVRFADDAGTPSPYGPLVNVTLQPCGISMPARVSSSVAGNGESEYYPFVEGDEVLVVIVEGDERAGGVIIGRLNQELDAWPTVVAGQDSTKNKFGFRRMRTPFIVETAEAYLIRSAKTGSQIGIDAHGQVIINDGDRGAMMIGAEAIGFSSGDQSAFMTVFPPTKEVFLGADTATFLLSAAESKFISEGAISFSTAGGMPNGTAITAEQVVAFVANVVAQLGPLFTVPMLGPAVMAVIDGAISALATDIPFTGLLPGGVFAAMFPTTFGPAGSIAAAGSSATAAADVTGTIPGFSRPGFRL